MGSSDTENNRINTRRPTGMFVLSMLIFGTVGIVRRYIPLPSALLAFSRGILGGAFLLCVMLLRKKGTGAKPRTRELIGLIVTGAVMGINWILLFEAYNHTTVAVATLCYYMEPTIIILLSPFVFKERLTAKKGVCAAVSIAGMVLVSGVIGSGGAQGGSLKGILLGLGAAVFYSAVVILNKKLPETDAYLRTAVMLFSAGGVMLPYLLFTGGFSLEGANVSSVVLLAVLGVVHTGVAYTLYFGSMGHMKVQSIAVLSYIDPVSALLLSALFLREPLTLLNIAGAVMIIGAAMLSEINISIWRTHQ